MFLGTVMVLVAVVAFGSSIYFALAPFKDYTMDLTESVFCFGLAAILILASSTCFFFGWILFYQAGS